MISLAAKLLQPTPCHTDVPVLEEKVAVLNLPGFLFQVEFDSVRRLDLPFRIVEGHFAFRLHVLSGAVDPHLLAFDRGVTALDFYVARGVDLVCTIARRKFIRCYVDFAGGALSAAGHQLCSRRAGKAQNHYCDRREKKAVFQ